MGVVKTAGDESTLNIAHHNFGDNYIQMLGEGVGHLSGIKNFKMNHNRISDLGAISFLHNLSRNVKLLDLADNTIGRIGCQNLA